MKLHSLFSIKTALALTIAAASFTSCDKNQDIVAPEQNRISSTSGEAGILSPVIDSVVTRSIVGDFGSPTDPSTFTAISFNLVTDATGSGQVSFAGRFNSDLTQLSGTALGYKDFSTATTIESLTAGNFTTGVTPANPIGYNNTGNGWYDYPTTTSPEPVAGRFIQATFTSGGTAYKYVIQLISIVPGGPNGSGEYNATITIKYKRLS